MDYEIFLKNLEIKINTGIFKNLGINNVEDSMKKALVDNDYAKIIFGENLYKELNWNILTDEEKTLIATTIVQEIRDNHYYGLYVDRTDGKPFGEIVNTPIATFENEEEANKLYDLSLQSNIKYLISDVPVIFTIKEKAPYHIPDNEIKIQKIEKLVEYKFKTGEQREELLHSCFSEFSKVPKDKEQERIGAWKNETDWQKTKFLNRTFEDYNSLSEHDILENYKEIQDEKKKLDIKYKKLKQKYEERYLNKDYVWARDVEDIRHEALMLEVEYQDLYTKSLMLKDDFYAYTWSRNKVDGLEYGQSNEYTEAYSKIHEFTDVLKTIHPETLVYGNYGVNYAKEDKRDAWWLPAYKISSKLSEMFTKKIEKEEENNVVVKAKNAVLNHYEHVLKNDYVAKREKAFTFEQEAIILRNKLNHSDKTLEIIFETVQSEGKDPYKFADKMQPEMFKELFGVDKSEYLEFTKLKEEYSRKYEDIQADKVFLDDERKIVVYTEKGDRGINVIACDMQGYLNNLADKNNEPAPYKSGLIKTFEFNTDGKFEKVEIKEYVNGISGCKEVKKPDYTFRSKYDLLSGSTLRTISTREFEAYVEAEISVLKTEDNLKTAEREYEIKTEVGTIKSKLGTTNDAKLNSIKIDGKYKHEEEDIEVKVSVSGPSLDIVNRDVQTFSGSATLNGIGAKIKSDGSFKFIHDNLGEELGRDGQTVHAALSIADALNKNSDKEEKDSDKEEEQTYTR